jgi:hypothetical protein
MDLGRKFRLVAKNDVQLLEFYQTVEKVVAQTSSRVHLGFKNLTQKFSSCNFIQLYQFYTTADSCAALDTILNFLPPHSIHSRTLYPMMYSSVTGFGEQCKQKIMNMEKR